VDEIDPKTDLAVLEAGSVVVQDSHHHDVVEPNYIMTIIHADKNGPPWIERKIYFSREDFSVQKQVLFDHEGNAATVGTYNNYAVDANGISFPRIIKIERPHEQYSLQLGVLKANINAPLTDDQFLLPRPEGSDLQVLDNVQVNEQNKGGASPKSQLDNRNR
jgi:hypothetical protein